MNFKNFSLLFFRSYHIFHYTCTYTTPESTCQGKFMQKSVRCYKMKKNMKKKRINRLRILLNLVEEFFYFYYVTYPSCFFQFSYPHNCFYFSYFIFYFSLLLYFLKTLKILLSISQFLNCKDFFSAIRARARITNCVRTFYEIFSKFSLRCDHCL